MLIPLKDHIIVKVPRKDEVTASGLIIPDTNKDKPEQGEIVAIGPNVSGAFAIGDIVLYKKYAPDEVKVDHETLLIVRESDIMALVK